VDGEHDPTDLPIRSLAVLVRDLQEPRPGIFWADLLGSVALVHLGLYLSSPFPQTLLEGRPVAILAFVAAVFALYRASYFNHEIAHQARSRRVRGFETVWNLVVGIPLLIPSFLYSDHHNHHSVQGFGTSSDAEYLEQNRRGLAGGAALLAACFILPAVYVARFALLAPAAWASPSVRRWVDQRASSLGLLGLCARASPSAAERRAWRVQEAACFCYLLACGTGLMIGLIPFNLAVQFSTMMMMVLGLHGMRIMAGHRYASDGLPKNRLQQVLDSFNFTRHRPLTWVLAPLGFHLHALHHLFPSIPYHNMPQAHRRIAAALPKDSPYHRAESKSYLGEVWNFLRRRGNTDRVAIAPSGISTG
jgi:fatty acid desaturase